MKCRVRRLHRKACNRKVRTKFSSSFKYRYVTYCQLLKLKSPVLRSAGDFVLFRKVLDLNGESRSCNFIPRKINSLITQ